MRPPALAYRSEADPASAGERLRHLRQLQLDSLKSHAARLPIFVPLAACFVGFIVWGRVAPSLVLGWIAAIVAVLLLRWAFARWHERLGIGVESALGVMTALSAVNGLLQGAGVALFFPALRLEQKAIVTMIMVSLAAGAVSANAAYSVSFFAWALPMFGALAFGWAQEGDMTGGWIGFLLVLTPFAQAVFVRENEQVLRKSFDIRYRNEALIKELELQRTAVAVERDRAEEANRAKSRFLASASHDLRQPLHTLSLYSAALGARKTDERTQEMAREIAAAIHSLGTLLDALLDISKLDAGAVQPEPARFALHSLLERVAADFQPLAAAKGLRLGLDARGPVFVETDAVLFERIVRNLVDNAIKYTQRGEVRLRLESEAGVARLEVSDTGPGIPKSEHERIFEEFFQLSNPERDRSKGIGLGLAIVRRLTDLLGIELELDSDAGQGTRFELRMPSAERPVVEARPEAAPSDKTDLAAGVRALVVDDEGSVRKGMKILLESWGFSATLASGMREALEAMRSRGADLIIADYRLREGETGLQLIQSAREIEADLPALLISGDTAPELRGEAAKLRVALLREPVDPEVLRRAIAEALAGRRAPDEGRRDGTDGMAVGGRRKASG
jgi:signal transduction histidine kinase/CheY-like chemotaxis protein